MASFTGVGDSTELFVPDVGEDVLISISGTYNMTIKFQKELGSKGSGAWQTINTYTTANATVSETYVTQEYRENLRLVVTVDTSGTATATLADNTDKTVHRIKNDVGDDIAVFTQDTVSFTGVGGSKGFEVDSMTSATATLNSTDHAGKIIYLDRSGGIDVTLPAATGTGHVYRFFVGTTTADAYTFTCAGSDKLYGQAVGADAAVEFIWNAVGGTDTTITLGGANQETGGTAGDFVTLIDVGAAKWYARLTIEHGSGTEATPFGT
jgi:hypothetical protein